MKAALIIAFSSVCSVVSVNIAQQCDLRSCYPATGDLMIGRETQLAVSSTCGLTRPESYCVMGLLKDTKKCFICDSRPRSPAYYNHAPKYMVSKISQDRLRTWWQSESGRDNVYIQLDLEAEFHFTHLYMSFRTFRPAALIIERSSDYGKSWHVYRYFAANCQATFPGIPLAPAQKVGDVVCEERYSGIEPSTEGEVVFRVLSPDVELEDPFDKSVQDLIKLTNLRVNLTKLHTLGDDLLTSDDSEVRRKYYYAIYELVVRGSCSCYGHAHECVPAESETVVPNKVFGRCRCTHNTTGRNCERCLPGYNDLPWRPASQTDPRECQKCNCNGHSDRCHFDPALFKLSGDVSGGVCDDCQHNTAGIHCEQCLPMFYKDPERDISDPDVCVACNCDPVGSQGGGLCLSPENGATQPLCVCKANVAGLRCDTCRTGFWNLQDMNPLGCISCGCHPNGTVRMGCDTLTGTCYCKRFVQGDRCDTCVTGYWGLGNTTEGCESCDCSLGGAVDQVCDRTVGQCRCRDNISGRRCNTVVPGHYYALLDDILKEANNLEVIRKADVTQNGTASSESYNRYIPVKGTMQIHWGNLTVPKSGPYNILVRYDLEGKPLLSSIVGTITSWTEIPPSSVCPDRVPQKVTFTLSEDKHYMVADKTVCLVEKEPYNLTLDFFYPTDDDEQSNAIMIESVAVIPVIEKLGLFGDSASQNQLDDYTSNNCELLMLTGMKETLPEICKQIMFTVSAMLHNKALDCMCDPTGTELDPETNALSCLSAGGQCKCKPGVIGRRCNRCGPGTFKFSSTGCQHCNCEPAGSLSSVCDVNNGQCSCRSLALGRQCNLCPRGHFGFPLCRPCSCNGHAATCDAVTGVCQNCQDNTAGDHCQDCAVGYFGNATSGTTGGCRRCQCPGGRTGNQFSRTCKADPVSGVMVCDLCEPGYEGIHCEICKRGYYGNPLLTGGSCKPCRCGQQNDSALSPAKCDPLTGECLECINNTTGPHCESCKEGHFGNATEGTCRACRCNPLGVDSSVHGGRCNPVTGACQCLPNVTGDQCDQCLDGHWDLSSGTGCKPCACNSTGSLSSTCNSNDGQCRCVSGFGGQDCSECQTLFWGDPTIKCLPCDCHPVGSDSLQCDRRSGTCRCKSGFVGHRCDQCSPHTGGRLPSCEPCHPCYSSWEPVVAKLTEDMSAHVFNPNLSFATPPTSVSNLVTLERQMKVLKTQASQVDAARNSSSDLLKKLTHKSTTVVELNRQVTNLKASIEELQTHLDGVQADKDATTLSMKITADELAMVVPADLARDLAKFDACKSNSRTLIQDAASLLEDMKNATERDNSVPPMTEDAKRTLSSSVDALQTRIQELENAITSVLNGLCGVGGRGSSPTCYSCSASDCSLCGGGACLAIRSDAELALKLSQDVEVELADRKAQLNRTQMSLPDVEAMAKEALARSQAALSAAIALRNSGGTDQSNLAGIFQDLIRDLSSNLLDMEDAQHLIDQILAIHPAISLEQAWALVNYSDALDGVDSLRPDINQARSLLSRADHARKQAENNVATADQLNAQADSLVALHTIVVNQLNSMGEKIKSTKDMVGKVRKDIEAAKETSDAAVSATQTIGLSLKTISDMYEENNRSTAAIESAVSNAFDRATEAEKEGNKLKAPYDQAQRHLNASQVDTASMKEKADSLIKKRDDITATIQARQKRIQRLSRLQAANRIKLQEKETTLSALYDRLLLVSDKLSQLGRFYKYCRDGEKFVDTTTTRLPREFGSLFIQGSPRM